MQITEKAIKDIEDIMDYIAFENHQPINALKIEKDIFYTIEKIGKNPFVFRHSPYYPTKTKIYREAFCHKWAIIYKIMAEQVTILRIIHSSKSNKFKKSALNSKK